MSFSAPIADYFTNKLNVVEEFKKVINEDVDDVLESTNTGKRKDGYSGIRECKYLKVANLGFPLGDNYSIDEERRKFGEREKNWNKFLLKHPFESDWKSNSKTYKKLQKLVRDGICAKYRHKVWMKTSGAYELRQRNEGYYQSILRTHEKFPPNKVVAHDINQDLKRTFPEHEMFGRDADSEEGLNKMRRVLLAYYWRNPLIAYCQCFNYIVGLLLLHFEDEEDAFWMFVTIVEEIFPSRYFDPQLHGAQADNRLFNKLFSIYLPKLNDLLTKNFQNVASVLCSGWFMSLYLTTFPPASALRIWDIFLLEGPIVLHLVALAFFKIHQEQLLGKKVSKLLEFLRNLPCCADEKFLDDRLFHVAFHSGYFREIIDSKNKYYSTSKKKKNKKNEREYTELIRKIYFDQVSREIEKEKEWKLKKDEEHRIAVEKMREKHQLRKREEEEEEDEGEEENDAKEEKVILENLRKELEVMKLRYKEVQDENERMKREVRELKSKE